MNLIISAETESQVGTQCKVNRIPDECPICSKAIAPLLRQAFLDSGVREGALEVVFRCPNQECNSIFVAYYDLSGSEYVYKRSRPNTHRDYIFSNEIEAISDNFVNLYNQSFYAEQKELIDICGSGYRKALEFLIKDYLKSKDPASADNIQKEPLSTAIRERVDNDKLKIVAERAAWLGNDESHYIRKFENKDLEDLKLLIELSTRWIEMEVMTNQVLQDIQHGGTMDTKQD